MNALDRLARSYERRFAMTFLESVVTLRSKISDRLVEDTMRRGLVDPPMEIYRLIDQMEIAKAKRQSSAGGASEGAAGAGAAGAASGVFTELIVDAGQMELKGQGVSIRASMNYHSPFVREAARTQSANLVTGVSRETKAAIRTIIHEAIRDGRAPAVAAREIRDTIGLTERDARAVQRFSESQRAAANTERQAAAAEKRIARYSQKLLNARASNIARTETIRASRIGQQEAWKEMVRDNLIDTTSFTQVWVVTDDDRLCEDCAPMDGLEVPLDSQFTQTERGVLPSDREPYAGDSVDGPPLHPSCRCTLVASFG